jgi:hypothetical protein
MKIYFSGSMSGGMADAPIYRAIITFLEKQHGAEILTARLWDDDLHAALGRGEYPAGWEHLSKDTTTYETDCEWIRGADLVIAECSTPSLGVGFEIAFAQSCCKPVICLYREGSAKPLSWMVSGNDYFTKLYYREIGSMLRNLHALVLATKYPLVPAQALETTFSR